MSMMILNVESNECPMLFPPLSISNIPLVVKAPAICATGSDGGNRVHWRATTPAFQGELSVNSSLSNGNADGSYDSETKTAVMGFQMN